MRTVANVVGVGQRMTGVSKKSGKAYDFQSIAITYCDGRIAGEAAATPMMNGPDIDAIGGICVGDHLDIVAHEYNGKLLIDAVLAKV